ncbi:MAG: hypothetical protein ACYC1M_17470 [Armatimonadota bacterium]
MNISRWVPASIAAVLVLGIAAAVSTQQITAPPVAPKGKAITKITVTATITAVTPVPDPNRVKPYLNVLVAQEWRVKAVKGGKIDGVKPGAVIRVLRWGILNGKIVPAIKKNKAKDTITAKLAPFSDYPNLSREYQVDTLPENYTAPVLLEVK